MSEIRVMTLNINYDGDGCGKWPERRRLIAKAMAESSPDIVALQAVRRRKNDASRHQAAQLLEISPLKHAMFQPMMANDEVEDGSGFVCALHPLSCRFLPFSNKEGAEDNVRRGALRSVFDTPFGRLHILNVHFSWVPEQTMENVTELIPFLRESDGPALLVGDFNATPDSTIMPLLRNEGWRDIWEDLKSDADGYTFHSGNPSMRIDYAWANPALASRIGSISIVLHEPTPEGVLASDHFGLMVSLHAD